MNNSISELFDAIPDRDLSARQSREVIKFAQNEIFFTLSAAKEARLAQLQKCFGTGRFRKVFLSKNLRGFDCHIPELAVEYLPTDFFKRPTKQRIEDLQGLSGTIVIINNNDLGDVNARIVFREIYSMCTSTIFVAWDWDNHHWMDLSTFLAAHSDLYAPAHHENLYLLSRYNWQLTGPVYCSSVQWSRRFLSENLDYMLQAERSDDPLGMHIPYGQFPFRMQVISTVNQFFRSVGFSSRSFHERTTQDKLAEWCGHKTHWIAPVLNDVPIRIFDALITGGIPLIPASMRLLPPVASIPREFVAFYSPMDIVRPQALVDQVNARFVEGGHDQLVARHRYALEHHHGDASISTIVDAVSELIDSGSARRRNEALS